MWNVCKAWKSDMSNSIAGAIDIDFLEALILPLAIDNAISEKLTLPLTLISLSWHWLTNNWYWLIVIGKIDIDIEIVMDIPKKLTLKLPLISRSEIIVIDIAIENEVGKNWHWYCHWYQGLKKIDIEIAIEKTLGSI